MQRIKVNCSGCGESIEDRMCLRAGLKCFDCKTKNLRSLQKRYSLEAKQRRERKDKIIEDKIINYPKTFNKPCEHCKESMGVVSVTRRFCGGKCQALSLQERKKSV